MRTTLAFLTLLGACSSDESPAPIVEEHFPSTRSYLHALFETDAQCEAALAQGVNCSQQVDFCADGSAFVMWTDIVGSGTYLIGEDGGAIDTEWSGIDGPATLRFELAEDLLSVVDAWQGATFLYDEEAQDFGCPSL